MLDKYGAERDPYCIPGTSVLRNRLGLTTDEALNEAERILTAIAANKIDFEPSPTICPIYVVSTTSSSGTFTTGLVNCVL